MNDDPVWHALQTARRSVDRLIADHPTVRANMAAGTPTTSSSYTLDIQGAVQWTSVEAAALQRIGLQIGRYQSLIDQALACLLAMEEITSRLATVNIDTSKAQLEARCDGWDNPTCTDNGIQNVWINGHCHWLCQRCWDRQRKQKSRDSVSTP